MLLTNIVDEFSIDDLRDLARFAEDLVLLDEVEIEGDIHWAIEKFALHSGIRWNELPLTAPSQFLEAQLRKLLEEIRPTRITSSVTPDQSEFTTLSDLKKHLREMRQADADFDAARMAWLRKMELWTLAARGHVPRNAKASEYKDLFSALREVAFRTGYSMSPGYAYTELTNFEAGPAPLIRNVHDIFSNYHKSELTKLSRWVTEEIRVVPPVLSIVLSRTLRRDELLNGILTLRSEFADLRRKMRLVQRELDDESNLKTKIQIAHRLEALQNSVSQHFFSDPSQSLVRRTWSLVKTANPLSWATGVGDMLLQWDSRTNLIGGAITLVKMEKAALGLENSARDIDRLFGKISSQPLPRVQPV